jgi:hypothetical protein
MGMPKGVLMLITILWVLAFIAQWAYSLTLYCQSWRYSSDVELDDFVLFSIMSVIPISVALSTSIFLFKFLGNKAKKYKFGPVFKKF